MSEHRDCDCKAGDRVMELMKQIQKEFPDQPIMLSVGEHSAINASPLAVIKIMAGTIRVIVEESDLPPFVNGLVAASGSILAQVVETAQTAAGQHPEAKA